ncbi:MAG: DUF2007 domain-containing protein [Actinomycetota bacterium]
MNDIVEIATYGTTFAARAAAAHLESEGIRSSVVTDNAGGAIPSMSLLSAGVRLVVASGDAERASSILAEYFTADEVEEAEETAELADEGSNA